MKVGVLFAANQSKGGVYQYSISFINSLKENDTFNEIVVYSKEESLDIKGVKIVSKIKFYNLFFVVGIIFGFFHINSKFLFKDSDIIFSPTYSPLLFLSRSKFIFTLHDLQEIYFPNNFNKLIIYWRKFMYKNLTAKAFKIITESYHVKKDIVKHYNVDPKKISVIESPPIFTKIQNKIKLRDHYPKLKTPFIFFPAQFWKHKNHIRVLKAFKMLLDKNHKINLVLTGAKKREYSNILRFINESKISSSVIIISNIQQNHMPHFFLNSKLVIAPTLYESISIPVFEAFYFKTPLCASRIYAIEDQVGGAGELFDPYSVKSIYDSLKKILDGDSNEIKKYILKGRDKLNYFSVKRFNYLLNKTLNEN